MFPDEFALRGYPEYPDSSDIHKPLYGVLKRRGLIHAARKQFALTERGVETAERLVRSAGASLSDVRDPERLGRTDEAEVTRILQSAAYGLYLNGKRDRILDTDFYAFLGCTVRTERNAFEGRLNAVSAAIEAACRLSKPDPPTSNRLADLMSYLKRRFRKEIAWKARSSGAR